MASSRASICGNGITIVTSLTKINNRINNIIVTGWTDRIRLYSRYFTINCSAIVDGAEDFRVVNGAAGVLNGAEVVDSAAASLAGVAVIDGAEVGDDAGAGVANVAGVVDGGEDFRVVNGAGVVDGGGVEDFAGVVDGTPARVLDDAGVLDGGGVADPAVGVVNGAGVDDFAEENGAAVLDDAFIVVDSAGVGDDAAINVDDYAAVVYDFARVVEGGSIPGEDFAVVVDGTGVLDDGGTEGYDIIFVQDEAVVVEGAEVDADSAGASVVYNAVVVVVDGADSELEAAVDVNGARIGEGATIVDYDANIR